MTWQIFSGCTFVVMARKGKNDQTKGKTKGKAKAPHVKGAATQTTKDTSSNSGSSTGSDGSNTTGSNAQKHTQGSTIQDVQKGLQNMNIPDLSIIQKLTDSTSEYSGVSMVVELYINCMYILVQTSLSNKYGIYC